MASGAPAVPPSIPTQPAHGIRAALSLVSDRRRKWALIVLGAALLALAAASMYYFSIYLPARSGQRSTLNTTVARSGDLILSASGTGTLQAAQQQDLAFRATGKIAELDVKVGDQVKQGQLLARLDNTTQQLEFAQAKTNLDGLTSTAAIGSAQQALAAASQKLRSAELQLEYLISPDVYYWENQLSKDENAAASAQKAADAAPADAAAQDRLKKAKDLVGFAQDKLKDAHKAYHEYVLDTFTTTTTDPKTQLRQTIIEYPTPQEITKARQDITIAQGAVEDAQNLYNALTGGTVPRDASGSGLIALEQARLDLQSAQRNLDATQIVAPFSGTVVSISAQLGPISSVPTPVGNTSTSASVRSTAVMTIADMSNLYLKTEMDESDYASFRVGNSASIVFDALPDQTFAGKVVQVDPVISSSSGSPAVSGLVELDPTSTSLLLGMSASVEIIQAQAQNVVIVPVTALHESSPGNYEVFVVKAGKLTAQPVTVGLEDQVNAEIKSGLQPGDVVSTNPQPGQ